VRLGGKSDVDPISGRDFSARDDDAHHASLADHHAVLIPHGYSREQTGLVAIDLNARIPKPRNLDYGVAPNMKPRSHRKRQEVDAARGDVFSHLAWLQLESRLAKLIMQLRLDEMDLPQIRLVRIARDA